MNGRKRHIAVDAADLLLAVVITAASVQDRDAARPLLRNLHRSRENIFSDTQPPPPRRNNQAERSGSDLSRNAGFHINAAQVHIRWIFRQDYRDPIQADAADAGAGLLGADHGGVDLTPRE